MNIAIIGVQPKEIVELQPESLLIIQRGTWEIYWALANEDLKVEFIKERIYIQSPASLIHEKIFRYILTSISNYLSKYNLGEVIGSRFPIELVTGRRAEPDIIFLSNKSIKQGKLSETIFKGTPTWIIEIISPNYREYDTITKRNEYRKLNVHEYWIVDPEFKTIEVINFKDQLEIFCEKYTIRNLKPNIDGFEHFNLDLEHFWKKISVKQDIIREDSD